MAAWKDWLFNRPGVDVDFTTDEGFMMCLYIFCSSL